MTKAWRRGYQFASSVGPNWQAESPVTRGEGALEQGFLYADNALKDLGALPGGRYSKALAINHRTQIVDSAGNASDEFRAFHYSQGTMHALNSLVDETASGWTIKKAVEINDRVMSAAFGSFEGGLDHALLVLSVPEPATGLNLVVGIVVMASRLRLPQG